MAITANKQFWTEFINIYYSLPSLWNIKDENYNNRDSRALAWNKLVKKLQEVEPDANLDSVKRKINTFRSNFNREVRKMRHTQKQQPTEVYNPTLWYFNHLSFLLNQKYTSSSVDSQYDEEITLMGKTLSENETVLAVGSFNQEDTDNQNLHHETAIQNKSMSRLRIKSDNSDNFPEMMHRKLLEYNPITEISQTESTTPAQASMAEPKERDSPDESERITNTKTLHVNFRRYKLRKKLHDPYKRIQNRNSVLSLILKDEAAIYGQAWACGFRKLSPQQKLFAKKAIEEILILGQLKALKLNMVPINKNFLEESSDQA